MPTTTQTVAQFIGQERAAGRFPSMPIDGAAGRYWLCDSDWRPLSGRHYATRQAAELARSAALDRSRRAAARSAS